MKPQDMNLQDKWKRYTDLLHAVQSGIGHMMQRNPAIVNPKHMRTGINSAMVTQDAFTKLLLKKGIFTEDELADELVAAAAREVKRLEDELSALNGGAKITLR